MSFASNAVIPVSFERGTGSPISPQYDACWPARKLSGSAGESRSLIKVEHTPEELDTYVVESIK
jgi:hypothetical protein